MLSFVGGLAVGVLAVCIVAVIFVLAVLHREDARKDQLESWKDEQREWMRRQFRILARSNHERSRIADALEAHVPQGEEAR